MTTPEFHVECFYNEYLPEGAATIHAVLTVTATGFGPASGATAPEEASDHGRAELIILDTSNSMFGAKLHQAKVATAAAIECLPDGVRFGVISGSDQAKVIFPSSPPLAVASARTRRDATKALRKLAVDGGTAMGTWLRLATDIFADEEGHRHAILLTDGKNESEHPEDLVAALDAAEGCFQCDCRGVGTDWTVAELKMISSRLLGSYDIVAEPSELADDFASMISDALAKRIPNVTLRIWTPRGAEVTLLKQLEPILTDLNGTDVDDAGQTREYPLGAWGDEARDYHLGVKLEPGEVEDEVCACRFSLVVDGEVVGESRVTVEWTDDVARSTKINPRVAEALGEGELAEAIQEGVDAHRLGDEEEATSCFGRAVKLASEHGNTDALSRLAAVVEIEDAATGLVRSKGAVDEKDVMIIETRSVRTVRSRP